MAAKKWQQGAPLIERLFNEYYRFSFFMAVHILERFFSDEKKQLDYKKQPLGSTLSSHEEVVRFFVKPALAFPPSDISNLQPSDGEKPISMGVTFMGLIGPSGVLPYWYTELALERVHQKDFTFTAFLDIFHHRLISLFYLAWKKGQLAVNYLPGAKDRISGYILSLMGLGTPELSDRIGFPEESLIYYSGLLSRPITSAMAIESVVSYYSGAIVQIEQFIDRIITLDPDELTRIGMVNNQLGVNTICGNYTWENQTKFRIILGPMEYNHFTRFLPSGDMLRPIFSLIRYMVGIEFEFEVSLRLKTEDIPLCILGMKKHSFSRLGWTTWLVAPGTILNEDLYLTFQESDIGPEAFNSL